jgi:uncharacterized protein (TIRG00374 family)
MKNIIKLFISFGLVYLIISHISINNFLNALKNANLNLLYIAVILQFLSTLTASYRWYIIMKLLSFPKDKMFYLKSYFKGSFFNQALPTSIGGDAIRVLDVAKLGFKKREAFYAIFIDRIAGLLGLLLLNLVANFLLPKILPTKVFWTINVIIISGIIGVFSLYYLKKLSFLENFAPSKIFFRISERFTRVYKDLRNSSIQLSLSILTHLFSMLGIFVIGKAVGIDESFVLFLSLVPPAILLTIIPISFAGWGIREGALVALFTLANVDKSQILATSIIYGIILIISSIPGLFVYLMQKKVL